MTIVTTFNDKLYNFSGKGLLKSIQKHLPNEKVIIYEEFTEPQREDEIILSEYELINIRSLNKLKEMLELASSQELMESESQEADHAMELLKKVPNKIYTG